MDSFIESDHDVIGKHIDTVDVLNNVLSRITGGYMHKLYFNTQEDEKRYRFLWGLDERNYRETTNMINVHVTELPDDSNDQENQQLMQDYIMRDLFLWAILMNRIEMAQVFLCYMKYRMCAALIATKILKEYYKNAIHGELKESYLKSADYFQQYAIECINQCEKNDANQACQIVLQRIELFGYVTCLQV